MGLVPIIGAAATIATSVINNRAAKQAASDARKVALKDQEEQFVRLREAAEKGGFNPLTALGSGQGINNLPSGVAPALSSNEAIRAVANVAQDVVTGESGAAVARQKVRDQLERYELERVQKGGAAETVLRTATTAPQTYRPAPLQSVQSRPVRQNTVKTVVDDLEREKRARENVMAEDPLIVGGELVQYDDSVSHTGIAEDRYGDIGGSLWGLNVAWQDAKATSKERFRQGIQDIRDERAESREMGINPDLWRPSPASLRSGYAERLRKVPPPPYDPSAIPNSGPR